MNFYSYATDNDEPEFIIDAEWDKMVAPVVGVESFDYRLPIRPILVNRQNGKLVVLDGRRRLLACKAANRLVPYCQYHYSYQRARREFLKHHAPAQ